MEPIRDRIAIVTGGTRGVGQAIACALLEAGARVVICARQPEAVAACVERLQRQWAGRVKGTVCDVSHYDQVRSLVDFTLEVFGGLDILVNNAGVGVMGDIAEISPRQWQEVIGTNLTGVYHCCHAVVPVLRRRGGGYILNIGSLAGTQGFAGGSAYNASKFGLNGFSEAIMQDLRHDNIRVSAVLPGSVNTGFRGHRAGREARWKLTPEDVARVVVDLLRHDPRSLPSRVEIRPSRPPRK
ncbi:MAG: SDR family oxidoreductase [Acidobacteria bacterium]|nr:SDR family oxidoreductase [Acidobacteriota bacterium]